jgi:hypothetical protein
MKEDILHSTGQLDCLSYYRKIFPKIKKFIGKREVATKTYIGDNVDFVVKRGSKDQPLFINDLKISDKFLQLRKAEDLADVKNQLSDKEILVWHYFVQRKLVEMHYACNGEGYGKPIDRIFIDIDKGKEVSYGKYLIVVRELFKKIKSDKELKKLIQFKVFIVWTGRSFHLYLLLNKKVPHSFYEKHFSFNEGSFTTKWAKEVTKSIGVEVRAHHERIKDEIILDSSATPSGKLARCPYSLYVSKEGKLDGVSCFVKEKELFDERIIDKLLKLSPDNVLRGLR